ncbi:MAG: metallophosphoesterase [Clostridiales bacterium]|nr:metallophosphoesterase [Clostridiales bacterium]
MNTTGYIVWIAVNVAWFVLLTLIQYPLRKRRLIPLRIVLIVLKLVAALGVAYEVMVGEADFLYRFDLYIAPLYVALCGDTVGDILTLPVVIARKRKKNTAIQVVVSALLTIAYLVFGTANMQYIVPNRLSYSSGKLSDTHKFVFLSDLHVGSAQSEEIIRGALFRMTMESPEFILLGGDIVDEYTTKEEMEHIFAMFGALDVPVYFIYGNHDRQPAGDKVGGRTFSDEELEAAALGNGVKILDDEWVEVASDLVLFGRDDITHADRKALSDIPARPSGKYVIMVDHSPYQKEDITNSGADLQLSGHTHAGQIFPLKTLYSLAGYDAFGSYHYGDTDLYVSSGIAGWSFPFRSEEGCRYEVVTLKPQ